VHQTFGAGHAAMFAWDPFWRSWLPQSERMFLNAALLPTGAEIPANVPAIDGDELGEEPIPEGKLTNVAPRPATATHDTGKDLIIRVKAKRGKAFRKAVRKAKLDGEARANMRWVKKRKTLTLIVRNGRSYDHEVMPLWVHRLEAQMAKRKIKPLVALTSG
jgi:hypothetical protein